MFINVRGIKNTTLIMLLKDCPQKKKKQKKIINIFDHGDKIGIKK